MVMSRLSKFFVNREARGRQNFQAVQQYLSALPAKDIRSTLEIGCGIGTVSALLAESYGLEAWGTDHDPQQIAIAKSLYPETDRLRFQVEDVTGLSFGDARFDLVITQKVLHHIPRWQKAIREMVRVLQPGGYFIYDDIVFHQSLKKLASRMARGGTPYTFDEIREVCQGNHLTVLQQHRSMGLLFPQFCLVLKKL